MSSAELTALARNAGFELERRDARKLAPELLVELHQFSTRMMAESLEHFAYHAQTNDVLYVFRRATSGDVEGFQFWRALTSSHVQARVVLGGKLRVRPGARRHGLHLISGLSYLLEQRAAAPNDAIIRIGVASLFGFVSVVRRLERYDFVDADGPRRELVPIVDELTRVSHFRFDPTTGLVHVGIQMTPEQLAPYPASYFDRPEAKAYVARNPDYRSNGCYLAYAFDVDEGNLRALTAGTREACRR